MTPPTMPAPAIVRQAVELTDRDVGDPFVGELTAWLGSSPRFQAFATTYRGKIHKKVRHASDAEALRDVRTELLAAHRLLVDQRFTVEYETYGSGKTGPDLTVAFRSSSAFNLEVTRLRKPPDPRPWARRSWSSCASYLRACRTSFSSRPSVRPPPSTSRIDPGVARPCRRKG